VLICLIKEWKIWLGSDVEAMEKTCSLSSSSNHQSMESFLKRRTSLVPSFSFSRIMGGIYRQSYYTPAIDGPEKTLQTGKTILITGGSVGIGFETAKALCERGAFVVIANRTASKLEVACNELLPFCKHGGSIGWLAVDLSDIESVLKFVSDFQAKFPNKKIDTLIENAGVWPRQHSLSPQGLEAAFATNLVGHYLLRQRLHNLNLFASNARLVVVTGDIYIKANDCTKDFEYTGEGEMAYCRSKLGVHWMYDEFHRRYPQYEMAIVHPGVNRTELALDDHAFFGLARLIKSVALLNETQGAQTTLVCALAKSEDIVNGGYYTNCGGLITLDPRDPVNDKSKRTVLIGEVDSICAPYLSRS
jgi:NAD(P)-dependent dehydrogenase (short-subunit alcohol dehydrogenase family)